jgi:hypothetical protein
MNRTQWWLMGYGILGKYVNRKLCAVGEGVGYNCSSRSDILSKVHNVMRDSAPQDVVVLANEREDASEKL